jgi:hypothetical protein
MRAAMRFTSRPHTSIVKKTILALDGHDASGKTTLAKRLAAVLGGVHVRPFAGSDGPRLLALAATDPDGVISFAEDSLAAAAERARADVLVFDRHWLTVCSLLPTGLWTRLQGLAATPTALCWADLPTTLARLRERGEDPQPAAEHIHYLDIYLRLASAHGCLLLRTDREPEEQSLDRLIAWSRPHLRTAAGRGQA